MTDIAAPVSALAVLITKEVSPAVEVMLPFTVYSLIPFGVVTKFVPPSKLNSTVGT